MNRLNQFRVDINQNICYRWKTQENAREAPD